ncbi:MAG: phasin family protein [Betaproteobacteria bacterium]|nr:phasin family protein [Betaproteobacteria bacterium]
MAKTTPSDHVPHATPDKTKDTEPAAIGDAAARIAAIMTEANERLFQLQTDAAYAAFAENSKHIQSLLENSTRAHSLLDTKDSAAALAQWPTLYQENAKRMVQVTRSWFDIVSQTQAEMAKVLGEPLARSSPDAQQYFDHFTKAITEWHETAARQVRGALGLKGASAGESPDKKG